MVLNGVSLERLQDRRALLRSVDQFRRDVDATMTMAGMDVFTEQAMGLLTSSRLAEALDLSREDPDTVARYGTGDPRSSLTTMERHESHRVCWLPDV